MRQEFGVERVPLHLLFVEQLTIPRYIPGALAERERNARVESRKMFDVLRAAYSESNWAFGLLMTSRVAPTAPSRELVASNASGIRAVPRPPA
jgi:hypothetical protein